MFAELCEVGPKIIIDCEFNDLMEQKEKKSMIQQLAYVQNTNKRQDIPCNVIISGVLPDQDIHEYLVQTNY